MIIIKENKKGVQNEKLNNLMKVIASETQRKTLDSLAGAVDRNKITQPFIDAGGTPAAVLAFTIGAINAIISYADRLQNTDGRLSFKVTKEHLIRAKNEAQIILRNI